MSSATLEKTTSVVPSITQNRKLTTEEVAYLASLPGVDSNEVTQFLNTMPTGDFPLTDAFAGLFILGNVLGWSNETYDAVCQGVIASYGFSNVADARKALGN